MEMTKKIYLETLKSVLGRSILHYLPLILYTLPVTLHLNLVSDTRKFLQISHLLQLIIEFLICLALEGNKEGDRISFRFFSCLYNVFMVLGGNIFFIFLSVQKMARLFFMILLILGKVGL